MSARMLVVGLFVLAGLNNNARAKPPDLPVHAPIICASMGVLVAPVPVQAESLGLEPLFPDVLPETETPYPQDNAPPWALIRSLLIGLHPVAAQLRTDQVFDFEEGQPWLRVVIEDEEIDLRAFFMPAGFSCPCDRVTRFLAMFSRRSLREDAEESSVPDPAAIEIPSFLVTPSIGSLAIESVPTESGEEQERTGAEDDRGEMHVIDLLRAIQNALGNGLCVELNQSESGCLRARGEFQVNGLALRITCHGKGNGFFEFSVVWGE